jgi:hypothetical protein
VFVPCNGELAPACWFNNSPPEVSGDSGNWFVTSVTAGFVFDTTGALVRVSALVIPPSPLEITSGTKMESTTAFAISSSNLLIAVAVSISLRNKTTSQVARFFDSVR